MTVERARVGAAYAVPGQKWLLGKEYQDQEWDLLRRRWHTDMQTGGWQLCEDPKETTEYDEQHGQVILHIRAAAWREAHSTPIDYGARGGQPFGYA